MKKYLPFVLIAGVLLMVCFIPSSDATGELWVNGVNIIENPTSVEGVTYNGTTNTLTLNGATLSTAHSDTFQENKYYAVIFSTLDCVLNIVVDDDSTITNTGTEDDGTHAGIFTNLGVTITGESTLSISTTDGDGILAKNGAITIEDDVTIETDVSGYGVNGLGLNINGGELDCTSDDIDGRGNIIISGSAEVTAGEISLSAGNSISIEGDCYVTATSILIPVTDANLSISESASVSATTISVWRGNVSISGTSSVEANAIQIGNHPSGGYGNISIVQFPTITAHDIALHNGNATIAGGHINITSGGMFDVNATDANKGQITMTGGTVTLAGGGSTIGATGGSGIDGIFSMSGGSITISSGTADTSFIYGSNNGGGHASVLVITGEGTHPNATIDGDCVKAVDSGTASWTLPTTITSIPEEIERVRIEANETVVNNYGSIRYLYGSVTNNRGTVSTLYSTSNVTNNYGSIGQIYGTSTVGANSGSIFELNGGVVTSNTGTISTIYGGTVVTNSGMIYRQSAGNVTTNALAGTIDWVRNGTVTTNDGTINEVDTDGTVATNAHDIDINRGAVATNSGTVTNNYGTVTTNNGLVVNNRGTVSGGSGTVTNTYYLVTLTNNNSATVINSAIDTVDSNSIYVSTDSAASLVSSAGFVFSSTPTATGCTLVRVDDTKYNITEISGPITITASTESNSECLFWVGNDAVTGTSSGTGWSYNSGSNILTLTNANLTGFHYGAISDYNDDDIVARAIIYDGRNTGLNIVLEGDNVVSCEAVGVEYAIYVKGSLNISGNGSLDAHTYCGGSVGIWSTNGLTISDGDIDASGRAIGMGSSGNMVFSGGTIEATSIKGYPGIYSLSASMLISGADITAIAHHNFDVYLYFNNFTMTAGSLTLGGTGVLDINGLVTIEGGTLTCKEISTIGNSAPGSATFRMTGGSVIFPSMEENDLLIYAYYQIDIDNSITQTNIKPTKDGTECSIDLADSLVARADGPASLGNAPIGFTVTFNANGGSVTPTYDQTNAQGVLTSPLPTPTRTGYDFDGWFTAASGGTQVTIAKVYEQNTEIFAHWSPKDVTITFNTDGGSTIQSITQKYGTAVTAPANPTKTGYTFASWSPAIPATMPAENLTVTAQWNIKSVTITFNTDGGSAVAAITQNYNTDVVAPANPTKTGYTFASWSPAIPAKMPAENITITAQWTVNQYTITFNTDGGSEVATMTVNYGAVVTAPAAPTKMGYNFTAWSPALPETMPAENITVTAQWTINQYTITFDTRGGSAVAAITQDYDTAIVAPANPTRTGYTFDKWDPAIPAKMPAENITISALWFVSPSTPTSESSIDFVDDKAYMVNIDTNSDAVKTALADEKKTEVKVTGDGWKMEIPKEIITGATGAVSMGAKTLSDAEKNALPAEVKELVKDKQVFSLSLSDNSGMISFTGKNIRVSLPYTLKDGENASDVKVFYIDANNKAVKVNATYDADSKCAVFETDHFSNWYVDVVADAPAGSNIGLIIGIVVAVILVIGVGAFVFLKKSGKI